MTGQSKPLSKTADERLVVVGGGQAAAQLIEVARQKGFAGTITLISEELLLPYQRPPLSKQYLIDDHDRDWLLYRPEHSYKRYHVEARLGRRAAAIDRERKCVTMDDGTEVAYNKLAIVTGARARKLEVAGCDHRNVFYIRDILDSERLRAAMPGTRRVVVVGGGFIGLEAAAVLVQQGIAVTLLCAGERLIPRLGTPEVSAELAELHSRHGVRLVMKAKVEKIIEQPGGQLSVVLADGSTHAADKVIVGIGAVPNVELAQSCGLECNDGIAVDSNACTSDPAIFAAGDCTNHPNALLGRRLRLETVHNAVEQGRTAGASIAGVYLPYAQTPWVWSDQYDLRLQCVGLADHHDKAVLRGDPRSGRFSYFYFVQSRLSAVISFNQPLVFGAARRLLNERIPLSPEEAQDSQFDLTALPAKRARMEFDEAWPIAPEKLRAIAEWGHA